MKKESRRRDNDMFSLIGISQKHTTSSPIEYSFAVSPYIYLKKCLKTSKLNVPSVIYLLLCIFWKLSDMLFFEVQILATVLTNMCIWHDLVFSIFKSAHNKLQNIRKMYIYFQ